jgi:CRISPR-associated endoribonuclease Cas6
MNLLSKSAENIAQQITGENIELVGLKIELQPETNSYLFADYNKGLHAWFLQQIKQIDPQLSQTFHDDPDNKAFTLSMLNGKITTYNQRLTLEAKETYSLFITLLSKQGITWLQNWLLKMPVTINLKDIIFKIKNIKISLPPTSYLKLSQVKPNAQLKLTFLSVTTFRRKGNHFPLPLPFNVFQSYLRRWLNFSGQIIDRENFLNWIDTEIIITQHQLESLKIMGAKGGSITGFMGTIAYNITYEGQKNQEYVQLYSSLGQFAPFCATGHKTPFGLGQTRLNWSLTSHNLISDNSESNGIENQLAERIEELTQILMGKQKRQGGERGLKICQTKATIIARRERGESLKAIASDLEIQYETVKSYGKLARRILNQKN